MKPSPAEQIYDALVKNLLLMANATRPEGVPELHEVTEMVSRENGDVVFKAKNRREKVQYPIVFAGSGDRMTFHQPSKGKPD